MNSIMYFTIFIFYEADILHCVNKGSALMLKTCVGRFFFTLKIDQESIKESITNQIDNILWSPINSNLYP